MTRTSKHQNRRNTQEGHRSSGPYILIGAGLILLAGVTLWYWAWPGPVASESVAQAAYEPQDVVFDQPLHGIHEMGPAEQQPPFLPMDGPQPRLELPVTFKNLGTIVPEDEPEVTFVVRNGGDAPLTVSRLYTTCGCTTAVLTASVIPPGKVALLTVYFDADFHDVSGETVRRGVIMENNDRAQPKAEVSIQARVGE